MKNFRLVVFLVAVAAALTASPLQAKPGWLSDYKQAQAEAKLKNKLLLLDFTGSDWCGWCIRLDKEVFSKSEFQEYATRNLVLMEVDFPKSRPLTSSVTKQNEELANQYRIQGFPTIVVLNGAGKKLGEFGYTPGGPQAFIAELERLRKGQWSPPRLGCLVSTGRVFARR